MARTTPRPIQPDPAGGARPSVVVPARPGRGMSVALGILMVVAGVIAITFPFVSSIAATLAIGWMLVFVGVVTIVHAFGARRWRGGLWYGLIGLVFLSGGGLLIAAPLAGTLSLTVLLAAILVAEGVVEIVAALAMRDRSHWGWILASGIVALMAGLAVSYQLPGSAFWMLGFLVGLNFIFSGLSYLMAPDEDTVAASTAA